jgi:hypothetical protein
MTLALEIGGAFLGGVGCTIATLGVFGPRFARWYMKRALGGMIGPSLPKP